jgi:hypothetical protein
VVGVVVSGVFWSHPEGRLRTGGQERGSGSGGSGRGRDSSGGSDGSKSRLRYIGKEGERNLYFRGRSRGGGRGRSSGIQL